MSNRGQNPQALQGKETHPEHVLERLTAREADVGGIPVARVIPVRGRRVIGPWCFLDHAGPVQFSESNQGFDVGPHPHTGLQTFTWMLEGEVLHRDSLGNEQVIKPGQVNLMTAGRGIVHTEESLSKSGALHATQLWIALPKEDKATAPRFDHYPKLPRWTQDKVDFTLLTGNYQDQKAPTLHFSPILGMDIQSPGDSELKLSLDTNFEHGVFVLQGELEIEGETFTENELAFLGLGREHIECKLKAGSRVLLVGGEPLESEIVIWWNFVGHSKEEVRQAVTDWQQGTSRFGKVEGYDGPPMEAPSLP
ncbi:pirin family protein [Aliidiomarina minuta]|uniref:Pirin family protein n=1 Tax=Aliidiomarina minuta TaxID=880057 RepID=A0A432WAL5_9GAMM|nr:pirin family protein [Aliidiomarina minuta]RUO27026.1 pirin family protein [Aliidiomarina minuta]